MYYPLFFIISNLLLFFYFLPLNCIADNDCLEEGEFITNTRISPGGIFEFGVFTPDGSSDKRSKYLGIWYYNETNPRIVVWVANRDKPISETNVSLVMRDSAAKILGENGATYWSKNVDSSNRKERGLTTSMKVNQVFLAETTIKPTPANSPKPQNNRKHATRGISLCLEDGGDLILIDRNTNKKLWNMFDDNNLETDTFLPGMVLDGSLLNLTSWKSSNNSEQGMFTVQQSPEDDKKLLITLREELHSDYYWQSSDYYWQSEATPFDDPVPPQVLDLLNTTSGDYNSTTRLVMNFTGQVQLWRRESGKGWILVWREPRDNCDRDKICGNFASCNSNNGRFCKCLPGFSPVSPKKWESKIFSDGCEANSGSNSPAKRIDSENDSFLTLPLMKVGKPDYNESHEEKSCKSECLLDSRCLAYSCGVGGCESQKKCMKWTNTLIYLEEGYNKGITLFVRTTKSDIEPTPRSCEPCGTYIIPYPLTTGKDCGDVSYSYFHCNQSTGQLSFLAHSGTFNVTSIDPDGKRFYIQAKDPKRCDNGFKDSLVSSHNAKSKPPPFVVKNCSIVQEQSFDGIEPSLIEVEMNWKLPPEPPCNKSSDCQGWLHTTCKEAKGGQRRCLCGSKYHWDNSLLKCTKKRFPFEDVIASIAAVLLFILLGGIFLIYYRIQKRKITRKQGSDEFKVEDAEGIDVPFFDWESILVATNNFADEHKLGKGGFGSVYKGTLPDGREVAVKRLLNVSLQGIEEFRTEVVLIAKLQHRNLVRLLGYCAKSDEKILLYEFMSNGSLDSCVFDETHSVFLDWEKRFDIIIGIARGLLYLHEDSRLRIIHRDLKPSNILLDEELNAKISDFGIARIIGGKETEGSTKIVVGTYGYMSPEYAYGGVFSIKSDVFSFGVVVLETISGRRNSRIFEIEFGTSLPGQAWRLWKEDRGLDLMDKTIQETCKQSQVLKCIHVGLLCVQEEPSDRPTMSSVVLMLSSDNPSLPTPKQPAFSSKKPPSTTTASSSGVKNTSLSDPSFGSDPSFNDMITMSTEGR